MNFDFAGYWKSTFPEIGRSNSFIRISYELFCPFEYWQAKNCQMFLFIVYYRVTNNAQTLEKALFSKLNLTKS